MTAKKKAEPKIAITGTMTALSGGAGGKRGDAHDRIDALLELLDRNGITVPESLR